VILKLIVRVRFLHLLRQQTPGQGAFTDLAILASRASEPARVPLRAISPSGEAVSTSSRASATRGNQEAEVGVGGA
jgi:hypothetical protein